MKPPEPSSADHRTPYDALQLLPARREGDDKRINRARQIEELMELHFDGTIGTREELAEKLSDLLDRPITISKDPSWWGGAWHDGTYTAYYETTFHRKKRTVGFVRFVDGEVIHEERQGSTK